jgi:hypothetical protein
MEGLDAFTHAIKKWDLGYGKIRFRTIAIFVSISGNLKFLRIVIAVFHGIRTAKF